MTVTLITRRQARPGQEANLLAMAVSKLADERYRESRSVRLFQGREDPGLLLHVATWDNREAFARGMRDRGIDELDALCVGPPERYFCDWLSFYTVVTSQPALVTCTMVEVPSAKSDALAAFLKEMTATLRAGLPDMVLHGLYRDQDAPCRFVVLQGWQSPEAWERARQEIMPYYQGSLRALDATVTRLIAVPRVRVEQWRHPTGTNSGPGA